ncbi:hypothetical protein ACFVGY_12930 [Streptomyces sp. NPDC127106]|uniref:hypothetical protein n=1 Tax=Streptomyces sp. NPDC127106 TaxID=3345360 RepID=UPI00363562F1
MWGRGTVLGDPYTLTERIGGGGMGEVWRADDGVLRRQVAVKVLLPALLDAPGFAARFRREATILASFSHPGMVSEDGGDRHRLDCRTAVTSLLLPADAGCVDAPEFRRRP